MNPASLNKEFYPDSPIVPALEMQVKGMSPIQMRASNSRLTGRVLFLKEGIPVPFFESKFRNGALGIKSLTEMVCCSVESQFRRTSKR
jgi:hypothetical protein